MARHAAVAGRGIALIAALAIAGATAPAVAESASALLKRGVAMLEAGDHQGARALFAGARRDLPGWYPGHLYFGIAEAHLNPKSDTARRAFARAAALAPSNPRCHYHYGVALVAATEFAAAEAALRRAIELRPGIRDAQYQLGLAVEGQGRERDALNELERARALGPTHVPTHRALAALYERLGEPLAAERILRRLVSIDGSDGEGAYLMVRFFGRLGDEERAAAQWKALADADQPPPADYLALREARDTLVAGDVEGARTRLGRLRQRRPDWFAPHYYWAVAESQLDPASGAALTAFTRAITLAPLHPGCHFHLGVALRAAGRPAEAERHLRRALALRPELPGARYQLGLALRALGSTGPALAELEQARAATPDHPGTLAALAEMYEAAGRYADAEAALRDAIRSPPTDGGPDLRLLELLERLGAEPEAAQERERLQRLAVSFAPERELLWRGVAALSAGELGPARELLSQLRARSPGWFMGHLYWAAAENTLSPGSDSARAALERALELVPYNARGHYQLGVVHLQANRPAKAEASLRRALELRPAIQDGRFRLAVLLREQGRHEEALAELERARLDHPDHLATLATLAEIYEAAARHREAEEALREVTRIQPEVAYHYYRLAEFLERTGQASKARRARRQVERIDPRPKRRMRPLPPARK